MKKIKLEIPTKRKSGRRAKVVLRGIIFEKYFICFYVIGEGVLDVLLKSE